MRSHILNVLVNGKKTHRKGGGARETQLAASVVTGGAGGVAGRAALSLPIQLQLCLAQHGAVGVNALVAAPAQ